MFRAVRERTHVSFNEIGIKIEFATSTETAEARDGIFRAERNCQLRFIYLAEISFDIKYILRKENLCLSLADTINEILKIVF